MIIKASNANQANWREISVKSNIPTALQPLDEIAHNMWWSWSHEAKDLFKDLNPDLWSEVGENPVLMLARMSYEKMFTCRSRNSRHKATRPHRRDCTVFKTKLDLEINR